MSSPVEERRHRQERSPSRTGDVHTRHFLRGILRRMPMSLKPEAAPRAGDAMWGRWLAASVAPNPRVLLLVTVGWVTELVLLGCVSDNIYYVSRPARWLAVMFAAWFWVTMGWVVWLVGSRLRDPLARNLGSTVCGRLRGVRGRER